MSSSGGSVATRRSPQLDDGLVEVTRVRVKRGCLPGNGIDYPGMRVADDGDVVVGVEIAPAIGRFHPRPFPTHEVQRTPVAEWLERASHDASAPCDELLVSGARWPRGRAADGRQAPG